MRARIKKTNKIVVLTPSTKEPKIWIADDGDKYAWGDFDPIRVESATFVGVVSKISVKIPIVAKGGID